MLDFNLNEIVDKPTLRDIARTTYTGDFYTPLDESEVTKALETAGIDASDEKERARFRRLVAAKTQTSDVDFTGLSDQHIVDAEDKLGWDADPKAILDEARQAAFHEKMEREEEEEYNQDREQE